MKAFTYGLLLVSSVFARPFVESARELPDSPLNDRDVFPYQSYQSINGTSPILDIKKSGEPLGSGYLFFSQEIGLNLIPRIMTDDGDLVWIGPRRLGAIHNFRVQQFNGSDVLTYYHSTAGGPGWRYGAVTILDNTYRVLYEVCPMLNLYVPQFPTTAISPGITTTPTCQGDLHESYITADGTMLVTAYNVTRGDLTAVGGGSNDWVVDGQFHELDIETGEILFSWKSLDHVNVAKTQIPIGQPRTNDTLPFDYFHINSVQKLPNGQYLVDSRHTFAMYLIDTDGQIIWTFNGYNGGDFAPLPDSNSQFSYQHDGRVQSINESSVVVSLFNNFNTEDSPPKPSSGMMFRLNTVNKSCTLLNRFQDPNDLQVSTSQGNTMLLPNGNALVSFGNIPFIKEFGPANNSDVRMAIQFGSASDQDGSYRVFRNPWSGTPYTLPSVVAQQNTSKGYVSWNGATDITNYVVFAGKTQTTLKAKINVPKSGFETAFNLPPVVSKGGFVRVYAYQGSTLVRRSPIVSVTS